MFMRGRKTYAQIFFIHFMKLVSTKRFFFQSIYMIFHSCCRERSEWTTPCFFFASLSLSMHGDSQGGVLALYRFVVPVDVLWWITLRDLCARALSPSVTHHARIYYLFLISQSKIEFNSSTIYTLQHLRDNYTAWIFHQCKYSYTCVAQ